MRRIVNKAVLNPHIETVINNCSLLYGIDKKLLRERMNKISRLYLSNEMKSSWFMCVNGKTHEMEINDKYADVDRYGRLITREDDKDAFRGTFIHELIHVASTKDNGVGVRLYNEIDRLGLNEGLTQMMADDITGNVTTKYYDGYFPLKTVAKILRSTFGSQVIIDSFFYDSKALGNSLNRISNNPHYYDELCKRMNAVENMKELYRNTDDGLLKRQGQDLYRKYIDLLYKDVILNVVLPRLKVLNDKDKKTYIKNVLSAAKEDSRSKDTIFSMLSEYANYDNNRISTEINRLKAETTKKDNIGSFISFADKNEHTYLKHIMLKQDGTIVVLDNPNYAVESEQAKDKVYSDLFDKKYDSKITPQYLDSIYNNIVKGKPLNIRNSDPIERKIIFLGLRRKLCNRKDIFILNDKRELDNSQTIPEIKYISTDKYLSFKDAKVLCEKFGLFKNSNNPNDIRTAIIDKKYNIRPEDLVIIERARIANNWMLALGLTNNGEKNIEVAFSPKNKILYDDLMNALHEDFLNEGNEKRKFPYKYCKYDQTRKIMEKFLNTPEKYEWVYEYFRRIEESDQLQVYKGVSFKELTEYNYLSRDVDRLVGKIVR